MAAVQSDPAPEPAVVSDILEPRNVQRRTASAHRARERQERRWDALKARAQAALSTPWAPGEADVAAAPATLTGEVDDALVALRAQIAEDRQLAAQLVERVHAAACSVVAGATAAVDAAEASQHAAQLRVAQLEARLSAEG